jgi:hypothetical protein
MKFLLEVISEVPWLSEFNSGGRELLRPRAEQVVALVAEGLSNRNTAQELNLSEHIVESICLVSLTGWASRQASNWSSMLSTTAIPAPRSCLPARANPLPLPTHK